MVKFEIECSKGHGQGRSHLSGKRSVYIPYIGKHFFITTLIWMS